MYNKNKITRRFKRRNKRVSRKRGGRDSNLNSNQNSLSKVYEPKKDTIKVDGVEKDLKDFLNENESDDTISEMDKILHSKTVRPARETRNNNKTRNKKTTNNKIRIKLNDTLLEQDKFHEPKEINSYNINLLNTYTFQDDKINAEIEKIKNILNNYYSKHNRIKPIEYKQYKIDVDNIIQFTFSNLIYLLYNIKSILKATEVNDKIINDFVQIFKNIDNFKIEMSNFYTKNCSDKTINTHICNLYETYLVSILNLYVDLLKYTQTHVNQKEIFNNNNKILFRFKTLDIDSIIPNTILKYIQMINRIRDS